MNKEKILFTAVSISCICILLSCNALRAKKATNREDLDLQRALAYQEIQNVMAAHTYCYEAQKQYYEIENFWSKRDDIAYNQNASREAVINYYCKTNDASHKEKLRIMNELFPDEVKNIPKNEGIGDMVIHLVTTPYIEIAADCKTAKGLWYVPSLNSEIGHDGEPVVATIWEKCLVDFVKEDGHWKIWHFTQWVQFAAPVDKSVVDGSWQPVRTSFHPQPLEGEQPGPQMGPPPGQQSQGGPQPYSTKRVAGWAPELPTPYDTWDDSMSSVNLLK